MKDKVILITGASSGIGRACAEAFAAEKAILALTGRNTEALQETKKKCCDIGLTPDNIFTVAGDLSKDEDCKNVVESIIKKFGRLDVLVNNAGILLLGSTESLPMEQFDKQMNVNLRSPFLMSKLCLPHLVQTKGNIVNVSSLCGIRAFPGVVAYNMSKAALDMFTMTLALEMAPRGVRVNSVNPGVIVTEIRTRAGMTEEEYNKYLEHQKTTHALGRVGSVEEVSPAVVFLASDKASFMTGVVLPIDGGRSIMCPR